MSFIPDALPGQWLLKDIQGDHLTTRALGIGLCTGRLRFLHRQGGCVSGVTLDRYARKPGSC